MGHFVASYKQSMPQASMALLHRHYQPLHGMKCSAAKPQRGLILVLRSVEATRGRAASHSYGWYEMHQGLRAFRYATKAGEAVRGLPGRCPSNPACRKWPDWRKAGARLAPAQRPPCRGLARCDTGVKLSHEAFCVEVNPNGATGQQPTPDPSLGGEGEKPTPNPSLGRGTQSNLPVARKAPSPGRGRGWAAGGGLPGVGQDFGPQAYRFVVLACTFLFVRSSSLYKGGRTNAQEHVCSLRGGRRLRRVHDTPIMP